MTILTAPWKGAPSGPPLIDSAQFTMGLITACFTTSFHQVKRQVCRKLPDVLAGLIASYLYTEDSDQVGFENHHYVSIIIDETLLPADFTIAQNATLLRMLGTYWTLPDIPVAYQVLAVPAAESARLFPWQVVGANALVAGREAVVHLDQMDRMHKAVSNQSTLHFNREGLITRDLSLAPPPRTLSINGNMLTENMGTGKSRTVLEAVRLRGRRPAAATTVRGRIAVPVTAIVVPAHTFQTWGKEASTVLDGWSIYHVSETKHLAGLKEMLESVDVVLFNVNLFTTTANIRPFFKSWSDVYELLWTIQFDTIVIDEAQNLVSDKPAPTNGTCTLTRNALVIKSLFASAYTILVSATPNLESHNHLDTYAFLLSGSGYPASLSIHDRVRLAGSLPKVLEHFPVSEITKTKVRNLLYEHHIITTGADIPVDIRESIMRFHDSSQFVNEDWRYFMIYFLKVFGGSFLTQCHLGIVNELQVPNNTYGMIPALLTKDIADNDLLGTFYSEADEVECEKINAREVHSSLAPVQEAIVRLLLWLLQDQHAKVLIYYGDYYGISEWGFWDNVKEVLKHVHEIDLTNFSGTVLQLNRKRKLLEEGLKTVLFLPSTNIDGTNFPFVTHVVVVGEVLDQINYQNFIGRATRIGRIEPLNIIHIRE